MDERTDGFLGLLKLYIMKLFDYVYYKVTRYYKQFNGGEGYFLMGIVVVSILQFFNVLVILALSSSHFSFIKLMFVNAKNGDNRIAFIVIITVLLIINYLIYLRPNTYTALDVEWRFKPKALFRRYNLYFIIYFFVSLLLIIISSKLILIKL